VLQKVRDETSSSSENPRGDPLQVAESFQDPEDLMYDIIQGMSLASGGGMSGANLKTAQSFANKNEETAGAGGNTPSVSI